MTILPRLSLSEQMINRDELLNYLDEHILAEYTLLQECTKNESIDQAREQFGKVVAFQMVRIRFIGEFLPLEALF